MYLQSETNLILSGMASSGTTVTALILAYILKKKFIYAGGIHKYIATSLGYDPKSENFVEYEVKYGEKWDMLWEKYIIWKVENTRNLVVDAKLAGFFVDHQPWLFEVYLKPGIEARLARKSSDERTEDILMRDKELTNRWKEVYSIDVTNENFIRENYDYLLDNSDMSISQTVYQVYKTMRNALGLKEIIAEVELKKLEEIVKMKGKNFFYDKLAETGQLISTNEVFSDWRNNFESDLSNTAPEWKEIVYSS